MHFTTNWTRQNNWNENLAAIIDTVCNIYDFNISRSEIFDNYSGSERMAHFNLCETFFKKHQIDCLYIQFVKEHLNQDFLPAIALMKGYRSQLIMYVNDSNVFFIDSEIGWQKETVDAFFQRTEGYIVLFDPDSYSGKKGRDKENQPTKASLKWEKPQIKNVTGIKL